MEENHVHGVPDGNETHGHLESPFGGLTPHIHNVFFVCAKLPRRVVGSGLLEIASAGFRYGGRETLE